MFHLGANPNLGGVVCQTHCTKTFLSPCRSGMRRGVAGSARPATMNGCSAQPIHKIVARQVSINSDAKRSTSAGLRSQLPRRSLPSLAPGLTRSYTFGSLLVDGFLDVRLQDDVSEMFTRIAPRGTDSRRPAYRGLPEEFYASRAPDRTPCLAYWRAGLKSPKKDISLPKRRRLQFQRCASFCSCASE